MTVIDWSVSFREAFLVPADWTPPARVKVWRGKRHVTMVSLFRTPAGEGCQARIRIKLDGEGYYASHTFVEEAEIAPVSL
jgi:hypothetical protein